ncbi:EamA family transporter [Candidatus Woesearchaeota archaeon]|nr:EamA family transporter [Candidatus Woesearchaeota archaeon]
MAQTQAKTKLWAIGLMLFSTILTSTGQILYKYAAVTLTSDVVQILLNGYLIFGLLAYFSAAVLLVIALKGGELSVLYPLVSLSFVWVSFLSMRFFQDSMSTTKWFGIGLIIVGVFLISYGSQQV